MSTFLERFNATFTGSRRDLAPETKSDEVRRAANGPHYVSWGTPQWSSADWDLDRLVRDGYERVIWVWRGVDAIAQHAANLTIRAVKGEVDDPFTREFVDDPILRNLNQCSWPGKDDSAAPIEMAWQFRYRLSSLLLLSKVGVYVEVVRNNAGRVFSLSILHPGHCRPIPDEDTLIGAFRVDMADGGYTDLPPYNPNGSDQHSILWIRKPHPTDPLGATTPLTAAGISIDLDFWARLYNRTFLKNDGRPGGLLAIKGGMEDDDIGELRARFGGGPSMAGRTTVVEADAVSWVDTAMTPRDAQYVQSRGITKEEILLALGVPESVIGNASGRTFDNADNEREIFWEFTMVPHLGIVERGFEVLTAGGLFDDVRLWHDTSGIDALQRAQRRKVDTARVDAQLGLITIDEFRTAGGKEALDIPETRVLWVPAAGRSPAGQPADVAKAKDIPVVAPPAGAGAGAGGKAGVTVPGQQNILSSARTTLHAVAGKDAAGAAEVSRSTESAPAVEWKGWASWPAIEAKALAPGVTHRSSMIAADVEVPQALVETVDALAAEYGMKPLPRDEWHVTLAFLGEPGEDALDTIDAVLTENPAPGLLTGSVSSPAVFGEYGGPRAIVLLVDVPGLADYRTDLVRALDEAGTPQRSEHGYTAHMTVGYIEADTSPKRVAAILTGLMSQAGQAVNLPTVDLYVGSARYAGPGEGDPFVSAGETGAKFDPHQRRDSHGRWARTGGTAVLDDPFDIEAQDRYRAALDAQGADITHDGLRHDTGGGTAVLDAPSVQDVLDELDTPVDVDQRRMQEWRDEQDQQRRENSGNAGFGSHKELLAAFEMDLPGRLRSEVTSVDGDERSVGVTGKIVDEDGEVHGEFRRTLYPKTGTVEHETFWLDKEDQRKGIATKFVRATTRAYEKAGYRNVTVVAGGDSGWEVWAKPEFGFRFDPESTYPKTMQRRLGRIGVDRLPSGMVQTQPSGTPEEIAALSKRFDGPPEQWPTPAEVAKIAPSALYEGWVGRRPLGTKADDGWFRVTIVGPKTPDAVTDPMTADDVTEAKTAAEDTSMRREAKRRHLLDTLAREDAAALRLAEEDVARALIDALDRQERTVLSRLTGTKARRNTRHWDPPGERKIDPRYVLDLEKWRREVEQAVRPALTRAAVSGARAASRRLHLDEIPIPGLDMTVQGGVERVVRGLALRFEEIQEIIRTGESRQERMEQIEAAVKAAYKRKAAWARRAAADETVGAYNGGSMATAIASGKVSRKMWLSSRDDKVRPTHVHADGQMRPILSPFNVGGYDLQYPGDPTGPPQEVFNCRCTLLYEVHREKRPA